MTAARTGAGAHRGYVTNSLQPREVRPGLFWLGGCSNSAGWPGKEERPAVHEPLSCYLVLGSERTVLVDPGHPGLWYALREQLPQALGGRPLDYVFPTHPEPAHAGNLTRVWHMYPDAEIVGDVRDYWMFHPEIPRERFRPMGPGESVSLGDSDFVVVDAVWRDLPATAWAYETGHRALFAADGLGYLHLHEEEVCGLMSHELPDAAAATKPRRFALRGPFHWMRHHDMRTSSPALRALLTQYPSDVMCSAHGAPITDADDFVEALISAVERGEMGGSLTTGLGD
ncbi:MBL fold metallo-hydrolase [Nocardia jinanensis]|uniref:Metallo-beta-lactamase domain-containing protein n=1 Tax=Nocardia jinanensis TaxID=382504 RepID=A0A917VNI5_9NOCA|nr:MBL fold metallo-hydrolase [Nocardia jinanensis]GGK99019.1 hypothetical protein GCM10011588_12020 [Nocardia jinanensis]